MRITNRDKDLRRIVEALELAGKVYRSRSMDSLHVERKSGGDPVTDAEREVNQLLFKTLVREGEGWFSEESADGKDRLTRSRVWLVDPLDGTKEFVSRIPEWCVSIALLEDGDLLAGGIFNPLTNELLFGSREAGIMCRNGSEMSAGVHAPQSELPLVLASRSECKRGEWERFRNVPIRLQPMGSVAYKLGLVAIGKADATWTLVPKHEWDIAAGVALLRAAGGTVLRSDGAPLSFNQKDPSLSGLVGVSATGIERLSPFLAALVANPEFADCLSWVNSLLASKVFK